MPFGKATLSRTQSAISFSTSSASPITASAVTWPLWGMLSQDMTVKGARLSSRRRISPARISPNTVFDMPMSLASATMSGCPGLNLPDAGSMK